MDASYRSICNHDRSDLGSRGPGPGKVKVRDRENCVPRPVDDYGTSKKVPVIAPAWYNAPRKLIGTGGMIHGAQSPGR